MIWYCVHRNIFSESISEESEPWIYNRTSLICAAAAENTELINLLLQHGADVNAMDESG